MFEDKTHVLNVNISHEAYKALSELRKFWEDYVTADVVSKALILALEALKEREK